MIAQDVSALPTFNPHGGSITHSSTGSKPDSPIYPLFLRLFLALGLVCDSRATFREIINSGIRHNTYSHCFEPPFTSCFKHQMIACPLETSQVTSLLCSRHFLKFKFESYFRHLPRCYQPDSRPCRGPYSQNAYPLFFRKYDGVPEEMMKSLSWCIGIKNWRHQRKGLTSLRRFVRIS